MSVEVSYTTGLEEKKGRSAGTSDTNSRDEIATSIQATNIQYDTEASDNDSDSNDIYFVQIHEGRNKSAWRIPDPQLNTNVLIISDSQFRHISNLPSNWEVQAYSGARVQNISLLLSNLSFNNEDNNVNTILLHVGINNRSEPWSLLEPVLDDLCKLVTQKTTRILSIYVMGVASPLTLKREEIRTIITMNNYLSGRLQHRFVEPLPSNEVSVVPTDLFGIHYDRQTLGKITDNLKARFLS
jgi:hypothetical protein